MDLADLKTVTLQAKQYAVACLIDRGFAGGQVEATIEYNMYRMAYEMVLSFRCWGEDDEPRLLADYPKTLWDHIKSKLGWKHERVYVWQQETIIYPSLPRKVYESRIHVRTWKDSGSGLV